MMVFMLLVWLLVIVGIGWLVYRATSKGWLRGSALPRQSPEEILKARYARGEIESEAYQRMLDEIREKSVGRTP